jgi:hypothetical protein
MEILDQGHLHPKLEVPRLTCLGWESNPGLWVNITKNWKKLQLKKNYIFLDQTIQFTNP